MTARTSNFVGQYVSDIRDFVIAVALSGENGLLIGPPGTGKTRMAESIMSQMFGDKWMTVEFHDGTPPEKATGSWDFKHFADTGELVVVTKNTLMDEEMHGFVYDEVGRANPATLNAILFPLQRRPNPENPANVLTSNYMPDAEDKRYAALIDRISMWLWTDPQVNMRDVARAQLLAMGNGNAISVAGNFPTWNDILAVRKADLTNRAIDAVLDFLETVAEEANADDSAFKGAPISNRRVTQWAKIIGSSSVYYSGTADFDRIPPQASSVMRFCWPCASIEESRKWAEVCEGVSDHVAVIVKEFRVQAYNRMKEFNDKNTGMSNAKKAFELGHIAAEFNGKLLKESETDQRVLDACEEFNSWCSRVARGENPFVSNIDED